MPSEQAQLAFGLQESAFALAGLNYPNGTACRGLCQKGPTSACQCAAHCENGRGGHHIPTTIMLKAVQLLREAITQAATHDHNDFETNMPLIKPSEISQLPALPPTVPLLKMVGELIGLFMEDGILGSDANVPQDESTWSQPSRMVTAFRWLRQFTEIRPEVFFRNDMQKKCTASCPTSGALPRDAQIVSLNMYDTGLNNEAEGCFPTYELVWEMPESQASWRTCRTVPSTLSAT